MLRPTPEEVLTAISYTFDTLIRPNPTDPLAVSYALTVSNMLRQLMLTMKHEERTIFEDGADLRDVLGHARTWLAAHDRGGATAQQIGEALALAVDAAEPAKSARRNWVAQRGALEAAIKVMQALRDRCGGQADYKRVRQSLRDYLDRSLDRERILIDGAFTLARR